MLQAKKSTTLSGESIIDGQRVIYLSAGINEDGEVTTGVSQQITNQELYLSNKTECRKDIDDFTKKLREIEDDLTNK